MHAYDDFMRETHPRLGLGWRIVAAFVGLILLPFGGRH